MVALESMTENLSGALAKVGVEGSNPFARSSFSKRHIQFRPSLGRH